jgi:hypothetical protein
MSDDAFVATRSSRDYKAPAGAAVPRWAMIEKESEMALEAAKEARSLGGRR